MSIGLLKKSFLIYKPIFFWNILVSILTSYLFVLKGFAMTDLYSLSLFIKFTGWVSSIGIYFMFYRSTAYFFKNQGMGFRSILRNIILYDWIIFSMILFFIFLCQNFL
ncbi:hypothetical protein DU508_05035 [Pedobacter chinensis]|uniref:Uncharacterized protein n=1 Tax=Pedobacter chinensis TaxID=2282421 RepID=A0A369Q040_9SPHI|nr:hypothetical protein DU508_05035 [Pedobacter chinensis]